jgi:hypothetical protein
MKTNHVDGMSKTQASATQRLRRVKHGLRECTAKYRDTSAKLNKARAALESIARCQNTGPCGTCQALARATHGRIA